MLKMRYIKYMIMKVKEDGLKIMMGGDINAQMETR